MKFCRLVRLSPVFVLPALIASSLFGQGATKSAAPATKAPVAEAAPPPEPGLYATIQTSMGDIRVKLYEKESPITVKNFQDLALGRKAWTDPKAGQRTTRPLYPGTIFHRVIPDFMIQGGDPMGTGMGGTDAIPDEFHPSLSFDAPGKLAMANAGPGTGSSQFFITEVATPHLDGRHTIFGQVVRNQELVSKIARVPKNGERPLTPVRIVRITFQRVGPGGAVTSGAPKGTAPTKAAAPTKSGTPAEPTKAPAATKSGTATKSGAATKAAPKGTTKAAPKSETPKQ
jgi:peptidyl-prolyl cis-trans isomerase A (cyclophilin A)